jgi:NADPH-dependent curcumin reductase CurA
MNAVSHTSYTSDCATQVPDAIEHMYAGKNTGKVTVTLAE